ncbi:hypothetical protein BD413DRAFT_159388 [Trametes elegans]|nr:hypothetical protein BD413DRAFT_159388 [Trametes elegans]
MLASSADDLTASSRPILLLASTGPVQYDDHDHFAIISRKHGLSGGEFTTWWMYTPMACFLCSALVTLTMFEGRPPSRDDYDHVALVLLGAPHSPKRIVKIYHLCGITSSCQLVWASRAKAVVFAGLVVLGCDGFLPCIVLLSVGPSLSWKLAPSSLLRHSARPCAPQAPSIGQLEHEHSSLRNKRSLFRARAGVYIRMRATTTGSPQFPLRCSSVARILRRLSPSARLRRGTVLRPLDHVDRAVQRKRGQKPQRRRPSSRGPSYTVNQA